MLFNIQSGARFRPETKRTMPLTVFRLGLAAYRATRIPSSVVQKSCCRLSSSESNSRGGSISSEFSLEYDRSRDQSESVEKTSISREPKTEHGRPRLHANEAPSSPLSADDPSDVRAPRTRAGFRYKGFADAFDKLRPAPSEASLAPPKERSFASILRHSKYIQMGDPEGKVVVGRITNIVSDDLYIDFGGKFGCVCKKPLQDEQEYYRGAFVRIRLSSLELSTRFLGADRDLTLLEADASLVGPMKLPGRRTASGVERTLESS